MSQQAVQSQSVHVGDSNGSGENGRAKVETRRSRYGVYVVALLAAGMFLSNVDAGVLPAVISIIQDDFHLADTQVGALISAWTIALAVTTIPVGYLADRRARRKILGIGLAVWSVATLLTGVTQNFLQMFIGRTALGVGEATIVPVSTSLIGDHFSKGSRGRAM